MNKTTNLIKRFTEMGERQFSAAKKAAELIKNELTKNGISFESQYFNVEIPRGKSLLKVDGRIIPSLPTSYISGKINSNFSMVSSLIPSRYLIDVPNINFNPQCSAISRSNMYFAQSVAIARADVSKVLSGKKIVGNVVVSKIKTVNEQILVGNTRNPKKTFFCHYDSIGKGAIDNASGVVLLLQNIFSNPKSLENNLFVFDGNEELSYDFPTYWGRGYREFFSNKKSVFLKNRMKSKIENIYVVDCVGYGDLTLYSDKRISNLAFPVPENLIGGAKVNILSGRYEKLMEVYHSDLDDGGMIEEKYLLMALKKLVSLC